MLQHLKFPNIRVLIVLLLEEKLRSLANLYDRNRCDEGYFEQKVSTIRYFYKLIVQDIYFLCPQGAQSRSYRFSTVQYYSSFLWIEQLRHVVLVELTYYKQFKFMIIQSRNCTNNGYLPPSTSLKLVDQGFDMVSIS